MSKRVDLISVFSEHVSKAEILANMELNEPLSVKARECVIAFQNALTDLRNGKQADTNFSDSHANTRNRTDLTRAVSDVYGFSPTGQDSPHGKFNPVSFQVFEELKAAASVLYASGQYRMPRVKISHPHAAPQAALTV